MECPGLGHLRAASQLWAKKTFTLVMQGLGPLAAKGSSSWPQRNLGPRVWEPKQQALPLTRVAVPSCKCVAMNRAARVLTSLCEE